jgi:hypothetical protein
MIKPNRRTFLKLLGGGAAMAAAHAPLMRAFAEGASDDFFIFIHASGGWDVTVWSDPRNKIEGLIEPASTDNTDISGLMRWVSTPLNSTEVDADTFKFVKPVGSNITFGPAIGELDKHFDKICLFNGIEMNTVSHPDGTVFSCTGRHLSGGRATQSSIDTIVANELGLGQSLPLVSVRFPSWYVGKELDPRSIPVRIGSVSQVASSLNRSAMYDTAADRDAVTLLLADEAKELAMQSHIPDTMQAMELQYRTLQEMLGGPVKGVFDQNELKVNQPTLSPDLKDMNGSYVFPFYRTSVLNASFAIEAMKKNLVRCVSFSLGGIDTHNANYEDHAGRLQEIFNIISRMVDSLSAAGLLAKTHIFVFSDFCRTPQINITRGRDHYPNNSALIISPKIQGNRVFGATDQEQLLPMAVDGFSDGPRPVTPPDILATLLSAVGIDERKYLREGEVIKELIA